MNESQGEIGDAKKGKGENVTGKEKMYNVSVFRQNSTFRNENTLRKTEMLP